MVYTEQSQSSHIKIKSFYAYPVSQPLLKSRWSSARNNTIYIIGTTLPRLLVIYSTFKITSRVDLDLFLISLICFLEISTFIFNYIKPNIGSRVMTKLYKVSFKKKLRTITWRFIVIKEELV